MNQNLNLDQNTFPLPPREGDFPMEQKVYPGFEDVSAERLPEQDIADIANAAKYTVQLRKTIIGREASQAPNVYADDSTVKGASLFKGFMRW